MDTIRVAQRAQHALRAARSEARRQDSPSVTPAHVLLGVLEDGAGVVGPGVVTGVLERLGVQKKPLIDELRDVAGAEMRDQPSNGGLDFGADVGDMLHIAGEEARAMHHSYVGSEHLLLGLVQGGTAVAAICAQHGLEAAPVRSAILDLLGPSV